MEDDLMNFESHFDIDKVSFKNVSKDFEHKFKQMYAKSLNMMSDSATRLINASGASTLGVLEKMAQRIDEYDRKSSFDDSYKELLEEYSPYTET